MSNPNESFWNGYLHWAQTIEAARNPTDPLARAALDDPDFTFYEPIFVSLPARLSQEELKKLLGAVDPMFGDGAEATVRSVNDWGELLQNIRALWELFKDPVIVIDYTDFLIGLRHSYVADVPLEFFVYRKLPHNDYTSDHEGRSYRVIDVGPPALVEELQNVGRIGGQQPGAIEPEVIGAVIDNDIGFLNERFQTTTKESRFQAIWLQSRQKKPGSVIFGKIVPIIGEVLSKDEIDILLRQHDRSERAKYEDINKRLNLMEPLRQAPKIDTHGTAVADLAYGADPDEGGVITNTPLLAVQLPPEASIDTTGTYSESYIVQGVRWLCERAREISPRSKLVINISYGVTAGAKNGSTFLEAQIAYETFLASKYGQEVEIVYAYGNSRNQRQLAEMNVPARDSSDALTWVLPPDNRMPCFLEVRQLGETDGQPRLVDLSPDIRVKLTQPDDPSSTFHANPALGKADPELGRGPETTPFRVYFVPRRDQGPRPDPSPSYLCVAIAPTRQISSGIKAAVAGDWKLELTNSSDEDQKIILQIQRGDTAPGAIFGGRQSWFDGPLVLTDIKDWIEQTVAPPLTNEGTCSRFATAESGTSIHTVGAQRSVPGGEPIRADYSAESAPWLKTPGPTEEHIVDGWVLAGVSAAGTYTGTRTRLSGTSAAAALQSRKLVQKALGIL